MVHLVNDLLDVSRITRGLVDLRKKAVEVKAVVTSAIETSLPLIESGNHQLAVDIPDDALLLDVDPTRIAQVVSNLLNNAAKYTPSGGHIAVTVRRDGRDVLVSVADTGVGIPADSLSTVFEMFAQISQNKDRAQGGLGIGLTLARRLVELHGGTLTASSAGDGKGSCFTMRLPIARDGDEAQSPSGAYVRAVNQQPATGLRVLDR